jgi:ornithine cyclodeaminase/alanine dehydrogenase-like protein (mu-crystallin family)
MLGSGEQARAQVRAMRHALPRLERITVWSPTVANRERFAAETQQVLGLTVTACGGPQEALADADVAALTTPRGSPDVAADWFKPGALIVTVVGMNSPTLGGLAERVVPTINRPNPLAIPARFGGGGRPPEGGQPPAQLAEVMLGERPARDRPDRLLVFDLAGLYAWDTPIMEWAVAWATARGVGTQIELE